MRIRRILTVTCGIASILLMFMPGEWTRDVFTEYEIVRLVVFSIFIIFVLSLLGKKHAKNILNSVEKMPKFAKILAIVVPIFVGVVVALEIFMPEFSVLLIRDENPGWNFRRGIFIKAGLQLVAAIIFATMAAKFFRKKQKIAGFVSIALVLVLIVMVGEELSWGQRIFRWETPEYYAVINAQGETNLHNLATTAFQTVLYSGCWILLVAAPFFARQLNSFFKKFSLTKQLQYFLPPAYFLLIFAPAFALGDPIQSDIGISIGAIMFYTVATFAVLLYLVIFARGKTAEKLSFSLGIFMIALFSNLFIVKISEINHGAATEYLELFINLGILIWAIFVKKNFEKLVPSDNKKISKS